MKDKKTISRRGFLSAMAALGSIGIAACGTESTKRVGGTATERAAGKLPDRDEFVVRGAHILTMDPALGDIAGGYIHVRAGEIIAVGKNLRTPGGEVIDGRDTIALP